MTISKQMRKYNSDFKLKVVLSYLSEQSTVAQICTKYDISKATLHKWVKQFKDNSVLHLKECEFRFNNRNEDLYQILLQKFRKNPI